MTPKQKAALKRALAAEEAAAEQLSRIPEWMWEGTKGPVPVEKIADSHYGILVSERDNLAGLLASPDAGQLSGVLLPDLRRIYVDATEASRAPVRRRFTIGHELGHWVLHCAMGKSPDQGVVHCRHGAIGESGAVSEEQGKRRLATLLNYPPEELEANQFAAAMLMPAALVVAERERLGDNPGELCKVFGVSSMAMERRLWFLDEAA